MRTWIYKRHHKGDPDAKGQFGICDCMGQHRKRRFEAVIGVGGIGAIHDLACKVNWIGIGAHKTPVPGKRGPVVTFDHFLLFDSDGSEGPPFRELAPQLAERMYSKDRCDPMVDSLDPGEAGEGGEVGKILALAKDAPPSFADGAGRVTTSAGEKSISHSPIPIKSCRSNH